MEFYVKSILGNSEAQKVKSNMHFDNFGAMNFDFYELGQLYFAVIHKNEFLIEIGQFCCF